VEYILDRAGKGSRLHLLAMYLDGHAFDQEPACPTASPTRRKFPLNRQPTKAETEAAKEAPTFIDGPFDERD